MKKFLLVVLACLVPAFVVMTVQACKKKPDLCDMQTKAIDGLTTSVATAFACENPAALKDSINKVVAGFNLCPKEGVLKSGVLAALCAPAISLLLEYGLPTDAKCTGGVGKAGAIAACQALFP